MEEAQELNLLASVGNQYNLHRLQQAAVLHDRGHRKPWETAKGPRKANVAHVTDYDSGPEAAVDDQHEDVPEDLPEEVAQAWMTYQSAKDRYRAQQKTRGFKGSVGEKGKDAEKEAKIKAIKQKSFCAGCGRRGHWHKDDECPMNKGNGGGKTEGAKESLKEIAMTTVLPADVMTLKHEHGLMGVADTACAKTVAGTQWLQTYADKLQELHGQTPQLHKECEAYRFGTGKIHYSSFFVIVRFEMGDKVVQVKTSIITGDIPLLLSRTVLGKIGMIYDVSEGTASFTKLNLKNFHLSTTASGHPAIPIIPAKAEADEVPVLGIDDLRLTAKQQYMSVCAVANEGKAPKPSITGIFYAKKLDPGVRDMLSSDRLQQELFLTWWRSTSLQQDFWVETPDTWTRIHVVPRRTPFSPSKWRTTASIQRDMLVAGIGYMRYSEGVCCSSGKWLEPTVDDWRSDVLAPFPLLWVGRSVFYKKHPECRAPGPPEPPCNERPAMRAPRVLEQDEQDGAVGGSSETGPHRPQDVGARRAEGSDSRVHRCRSGERPRGTDEEGDPDDACGTSGEGGVAGHRGGAESEQRKHYALDQGLAEDARHGVDVVRQVEGIPVSGGAQRVRQVGAGGNQEVRECSPRSRSVCTVVGKPERRASAHVLHGGSGVLDDAFTVPQESPKLAYGRSDVTGGPGKFFGIGSESAVLGRECVMGGGVDSLDQEPERQGGQQGGIIHFEYTEPEEKERGHGRDGGPEHHGERDRPSRGGRDQSIGNQTGGAEGQSEGHREVKIEKDRSVVTCLECCCGIVKEEEGTRGGVRERVPQPARDFDGQHGGRKRL